MKVKHFRCASMVNKGSSSGYRLIYLEFMGELFILDLYHHNDRDMHDEKLIKEALDAIREGDWTERFDKQPEVRVDSFWTDKSTHPLAGPEA